MYNIVLKFDFVRLYIRLNINKVIIVIIVLLSNGIYKISLMIKSKGNKCRYDLLK